MNLSLIISFSFLHSTVKNSLLQVISYNTFINTDIFLENQHEIYKLI